MIVQSSPSDKDTGVSRKRARADLLEDYCLCEYNATVLTDVLAKVAFKWEELAIYLKLDQNQIEECRTKSSFKIKLYEVISKFIQNGGEYCTLSTVVEALKSDLVLFREEGSDLKKNLEAKIKSFCLKKQTCPSHEFQGYNSGNVVVDNGKAALLGFQVTGATQGSYQWFLNGKPLSDSEVYAGTSRPFLFISQVNWKTVGEYECRETSTNKYSKMTLATNVSVITQKFFSIYRNWPDIPKDTWPPVRNTEYVNLALISVVVQPPHSSHNSPFPHALFIRKHYHCIPFISCEHSNFLNHAHPLVIFELVPQSPFAHAQRVPYIMTCWTAPLFSCVSCSSIISPILNLIFST